MTHPNNFVVTQLGDLVSASDLSYVVVKEITDTENDVGELLPPEDIRRVYVGVASFMSRSPDIIVTLDRNSPEEVKRDIVDLHKHIKALPWQP